VLELKPVNEDSLILYIAALLEQSFFFPKELLWGQVSKETINKNKEILNDICDRLISYTKAKSIDIKREM